MLEVSSGVGAQLQLEMVGGVLLSMSLWRKAGDSVESPTSGSE